MTHQDLKTRVASLNARGKAINEQRQKNMGQREALSKQFEQLLADYNAKFGTNITADGINTELQNVEQSLVADINRMDSIITAVEAGNYALAEQLSGVSHEETTTDTVESMPSGNIEVGVPTIESGKPVVEVGKPMVESGNPVIESGIPTPEVINTANELGKPVTEVMNNANEVGMPVIESGNPVIEPVKSVVESGIVAPEVSAPAPVSAPVVETPVAPPVMSGMSFLDSTQPSAGSLAPDSIFNQSLNPAPAVDNDDSVVPSAPPSFSSLINGSAFDK